MKKALLPYLLFFLFACSKGSTKEKDYEAPVVILSTPTSNQVFSAGQNITIAGTATDNKYLSQIHIVISNLATGQEYLHVHIHPNSTAYNFSQPYTAQAGISYKIDVIADDGSTNSSAKSVEVTCN